MLCTCISNSNSIISDGPNSLYAQEVNKQHKACDDRDANGGGECPGKFGECVKFRGQGGYSREMTRRNVPKNVRILMQECGLQVSI